MPIRIGLIVPSSNTTIETELPRLFAGLQGAGTEFTFHSSRVRMRSVTQGELARRSSCPRASRCRRSTSSAANPSPQQRRAP
jgi:maleate isomerase